MDVAPHGDEIAFGVEDLDAVALAVNDVDAAVAVEGDVVGTDELAGVDARLAPRELVIEFAGVDVNAGVAVTVGDVDVAVAGLVAAEVGRLKGSPLQRGAGLLRSPNSQTFSPLELNFWMVWMPSSAASRESSCPM